MEAENKAKRISTEQRELMLEFMKKHPSLATGRFAAPDGAKHKARLLSLLSEQLNSCASGVTKSADKWIKSWQDWRSDTKAKGAALKREMNKTGGGSINAKPLTALEEQLLAFLGPHVVSGHERVLDSLSSVTTASAGPEVNSEQPESVVLTLPESGLVLLNFENEPEPTMIENVSVEEEGSLRSSSVAPSEVRPRKRRRKGNSDTSSVESDHEDPLVNLSIKQLELEKIKIQLMKEQTEIARNNMTSLQGACAAFVSAMSAMEHYYNRQ